MKVLLDAEWIAARYVIDAARTLLAGMETDQEAIRMEHPDFDFNERDELVDLRKALAQYDRTTEHRECIEWTGTYVSALVDQAPCERCGQPLAAHWGNQ